jgi:hypothetical protein
MTIWLLDYAWGIKCGKFACQVWKSSRAGKHHIPGGLVTSFSRRGVRFELGIHSQYELREGQAIPPFLEFWDAPQLDTTPLCGNIK